MIRLPVRVVKELNSVLRAMRHLEAASARQRAGEIAQLLDKPVEVVRQVLALNEHVASLDAPLKIDLEPFHRRIAGRYPAETPEM